MGGDDDDDDGELNGRYACVSIADMGELGKEWVLTCSFSINKLCQDGDI